jgi:hypothetical protein
VEARRHVEHLRQRVHHDGRIVRISAVPACEFTEDPLSDPGQPLRRGCLARCHWNVVKYHHDVRAPRFQEAGGAAVPTMALLLRARPFLVFVPWVIAAVVWSVADGALTWSAAALLVLAGLFAWTLVEWVFHRAMHLRVRSTAISRFQDQAHLRHHREPHDVEHSVVMLRASIPLAIAFFGLALLPLRELAPALMVHAGLLLGYLAYELVHLATHAKWRIPGLGYLPRYHNLHHFKGWNRTFRVTTPLWDWVFCTLPVNVPERQRR